MKSESERMIDVANILNSTYNSLVIVSNHIQKLWSGETVQSYSANWVFGADNRIEFDSIDELELWASTHKRGKRNEILFRKFSGVIR